MNKRRLRKAATALLCLTLLGTLAAGVYQMNAGDEHIPGLRERERTLLRIWAVNAPGGGMSWLRGQLRAFEKQHPGVSTYLRTVEAEELSAPDAVLPDVVLFMPGDLAAPEGLLPITGEAAVRENGLIREELLRCGRWQGQQYGLPLCWGGWGLVIDSALEPGSAVTPAPTTLLGKPAVTQDASATPEPGYPLSAVQAAECALQSPGGAALFTLGLLLEEHPPLPQSFASLRPEEVYTAFQRRQCATAMLTTGQITAFSALVSGGGGFPFRVMMAEEVITDQVWLAGVVQGAPTEAAQLLSHLSGKEAQQALSAQGLHTARQDMTLYAAGVSARMEQAARNALTAINAFVPQESVQRAAWQFFQGMLTLSEALLPLL